MPDPLDYVRLSRPHGVSPLRAATPKVVAIASAVLVALGWLFFFTLGGFIATETHFTNRPQDRPEFRLTPWRPAAQGAGHPSGYLIRDALYPLTFHTLRYRQATDDGGTTADTIGYHADVRWGPTTLALVATALVPVVSYRGLKRLLR